MTCDYDPTLALHCLAVPLGSVRSFCPIIKQRSDMMKPDPDCEGRTPLNVLFDFTVQAMIERDALEAKVIKASPKRKHLEKYHALDGQVVALVYAVAMIRNPYDPNPEKELADVEMEATRRSNL